MSNDRDANLYRFVDERLAAGMSRALMRKLYRVFKHKELPLPVDFETALTKAGIIPVPR